MIATLLGPDGRWMFGAGDDTPLGWTLFAAYLVGSALAFASFRRSRSAMHRLATADPSEARAQRLLSELWVLVALILLVLGPNKQLDLQTLALQTGRDVSRAGGWYDQRARVQVAFASLLLLGTAAGGAWLAWHLRSVLRRAWPGLAGLGLILGYSALRASAMEKMPQLHGDSPELWLIEAVGLVLVCAGAARHLRATAAPG